MSGVDVVVFAVRCGLVMLFLPFSAADKVFGFDHAVVQCGQMFRPRPLATAVLMCGLAIEVGCSLGIVAGVADRACALAMASYCAATAMIYKRFWAQGDFWSSPDSVGRALFWDFLKNLSLGAGFLLIVTGADGSGLAPFIAHPLASTHPYAEHRP